MYQNFICGTEKETDNGDRRPRLGYSIIIKKNIRQHWFKKGKKKTQTKANELRKDLKRYENNK